MLSSSLSLLWLHCFNQLDIAATIYGSTTILSLNPFYLVVKKNLITNSHSPSPKKNSPNIMEEGQDIVIVGAGIAGLTTSLGLHRCLSSLYFYIHVHVCTFG